MPDAMTLGAPSANPLLAMLLHQQSLVLLVFTFGGMLLLMVLEQLLPRRASADLPVAHWLANWLLASFNFFVLFWLTLQIGTWGWLRSLLPEPGLYAQLHPLLAVPLLVVLVEFASYWLHRLSHRIAVIWYLHSLHHRDRVFDTTTSHRHHTAEVILDSMILLPIFLLFGAPALVMVFYQLFRVSVVLFNHSNVYVPDAVDRLLRKVLVTPDFHRLHHSPDPQYTNSNYGTIVPWFDYAFGTAREVPFDRVPEVPSGLDDRVYSAGSRALARAT